MRESRQAFSSCRSGATLMVVAVLFVLLVMVMGISVDAGRLYAVQAKAQNAADAALLGAVATRDTSEIAGEMTRLFFANYPESYMGSTVGPITVTEVTPGVFNATFTVTVPNVVMNLFGLGPTTLNMLSQVTAGFQITQQQNLELALVLDNTDSMNDSIDTSGTTKIDGLHQAGADLIDILFGDAGSLSNVSVSIVPFDAAVHINGDRTSWIRNGLTDTYWCFSDFYNCITYGPSAVSHTPSSGFMANRGSSQDDVTDAPPLTDNAKFRLPPDYGWPSPSYCPSTGNFVDDRVTPYLQPVRFGLNNKELIKGYIQDLQAGDGGCPGGSTRINVGLMWGWFTLSPQWQGLWDAGKPHLPAAYGPNLSKQLVLMTDGLNTVNSTDDATTAAMCDAIKAQGITIYTIGFGTAGDVNPDLLRNCASLPTYFFLAPSVDDLKRIFHQIGDIIIQSIAERVSQ